VDQSVFPDLDSSHLVVSGLHSRVLTKERDVSGSILSDSNVCDEMTSVIFAFDLSFMPVIQTALCDCESTHVHSIDVLRIAAPSSLLYNDSILVTRDAEIPVEFPESSALRFMNEYEWVVEELPEQVSSQLIQNEGQIVFDSRRFSISEFHISSDADRNDDAQEGAVPIVLDFESLACQTINQSINQ
jgi:hypothetical protein